MKTIYIFFDGQTARAMTVKCLNIVIQMNTQRLYNTHFPYLMLYTLQIYDLLILQ